MTLLQFVALCFLAFEMKAYSSTENQCLIDKKGPPAKLTEREMQNITECFKAKNCDSEKAEKMCPWALSEQSSPSFDPNPSEEKQIEEICKQCEQIAIIACGLDFGEAQMRFDIFDKTFLSAGDKDKPLIFEFTNPDFRLTNLNIYDNIASIELDRSTYQAEYDKLHVDLEKLSENVATQDAVISNIKSSHVMISNFENKWNSYFKNIEKLKDLFRRSNAIIFDWQLRLLALKSEPYCSSFVSQIDLASVDSNNLLSAFDKVIALINKSNTRYDLVSLNNFTENAIKLRYVKTSKISLEDLEKSIGSALKLDSDFMLANLWWYENSIGGLASGLHTRYYQYREPLRLLTIASAKGQDFIEVMRSNTAAPASARNKAINTMQQRVQLINDDIAWLNARGWQGQFSDQKALAQSWSLIAKVAVCKNALNKFVEGTSKVSNDIRDFESSAEPKFLDAIKVCEAVE